MANLSVQTVPAYGAALEPTWQSADGAGDEFENDGNTLFLVLNGDTSAHQVTINGVASSRTFNAAPAKQCDVDANDSTNDGFAVFGPFDRAAFNDANGRVQVSYGSTHAALVVAAVKLSRTPGA